MDGEIKGLNEFRGEHPPVGMVFWSFRVMVGTGMLMLLVSWACAFLLLRHSKLPTLGQRALSIMTFSGWVAVLAGWYVTEIGRQPWIVTGLLKSADVVADHPPETVLISLISYGVLYTGLMASYIYTLRYMSTKKARSLMAQEETLLMDTSQGA